MQRIRSVTSRLVFFRQRLNSQYDNMKYWNMKYHNTVRVWLQYYLWKYDSVRFKTFLQAPNPENQQHTSLFKETFSKANKMKSTIAVATKQSFIEKESRHRCFDWNAKPKEGTLWWPSSRRWNALRGFPIAFSSPSRSIEWKSAFLE